MVEGRPEEERPKARPGGDRGRSVREAQPAHSHLHEQIGYAVEGELNIIIGYEQARVGPGDFWVIPGGVPHTVQLLTKTARLVECFPPIREDVLKPLGRNAGAEAGTAPPAAVRSPSGP